MSVIKDRCSHCNGIVDDTAAIRCPSCGELCCKKQCWERTLCPGVESAADVVNHPPHYNQGKIEVIEFIEDKELGFHLGNAVKYIARAGKKDPSRYVEDLEKAIWYIRRRIELKKENPRRPNDMNATEGS